MNPDLIVLGKKRISSRRAGPTCGRTLFILALITLMGLPVISPRTVSAEVLEKNDQGIFTSIAIGIYRSINSLFTPTPAKNLAPSEPKIFSAAVDKKGQTEIASSITNSTPTTTPSEAPLRYESNDAEIATINANLRNLDK